MALELLPSFWHLWWYLTCDATTVYIHIETSGVLLDLWCLFCPPTQLTKHRLCLVSLVSCFPAWNRKWQNPHCFQAHSSQEKGEQRFLHLVYEKQSQTLTVVLGSPEEQESMGTITGGGGGDHFYKTASMAGWRKWYQNHGYSRSHDLDMTTCWQDVLYIHQLAISEYSLPVDSRCNKLWPWCKGSLQCFLLYRDNRNWRYPPKKPGDNQKCFCAVLIPFWRTLATEQL